MDFGLKDFLTLSTGERIDSPQYLKRSLKEMSRLQRSLSRKQRGSNHRRQARRRVAKLHRKIADQRRDFHFKTARHLLDRYDTVAIEDLSLNGMKRLWGRKVSDLSWNGFVQVLEHLACANGKRVVKIDRYYASSKTCHSCGEVNAALSLADRKWLCSACGVEHDRDENAALNILGRMEELDRALSSGKGDVRRSETAIAA